MVYLASVALSACRRAYTSVHACTAYGAASPAVDVQVSTTRRTIDTGADAVRSACFPVLTGCTSCARRGGVHVTVNLTGLALVALRLAASRVRARGTWRALC